MFDLDPDTLLPRLLAFVIGFTFHEFAHAWVADQMGDNLPREQGRVTLNPLKHLDPLGTLLIFLIGFGWAKPVMTRIWEPRRRLWVALAGPVANLILAVIFGLAFRAVWAAGLNVGPSWFSLPYVLITITSINILLFFFNLLPIPPLDGAAVLTGLLPDHLSRPLLRYYTNYPQALFVFLMVDGLLIGRLLGRSILWSILGPPISGITQLLTGLNF